MKKTKVIAMYLPQYHCIPENDEFWGKGFTDWVTIKKAQPLYEGHYQPQVPLDDNYYDLSEKRNIAWQAKLARENGIYGFGIYHYWFNNEKNLLTKPAEIIRDNDDIDMNYFFCWDNGNWKRSWSNVPGNDWAPVADKQEQKTEGPQILIPYILGGKEDWKNHYHYLSSHFKSKHYIKKDNKPVFCIFNYSKELLLMCECWNECARQDGFDGVYIVFKNPRESVLPKGMPRYSYEPHATGWWTPLSIWKRGLRKLHLFQPKDEAVTFYDYDELWQKLLDNAKRHHESFLYHGGFVSYDDSPRRGTLKSKIIKGATPEKFEKYMKELIRLSEQQDKEFLFLTAWNEWGEGAYLEPDTKNGYKYLEALRRATLE